MSRAAEQVAELDRGTGTEQATRATEQVIDQRSPTGIIGLS